MKQLLYYFIALIAICSCDLLPDPDYPKEGYLNYMPEETQIGANTFGCYINGKLVAVQGLYKQEGIEIGYLLWGGLVNGFWEFSEDGNKIMSLDINTNNASFHFDIKNLKLGINKCNLFYTQEEFWQSEGNIDIVGIFCGETDSLNINITKLDVREQIICGYFDLVPILLENGPDSLMVTLTNGQFDIKYGKNFYP